MLPPDVWYTYHNRPCDICEDEEINPREDVPACEGCGKLMCEDCAMSFTECDVCQAAWDEDNDYDGPSSMCGNCMESCDKCDVDFHPSCKAKHMKSCSRNGRAKRAVASAKKAVEEKEEEIHHTKRKLRKLEQELEDTKKVKVEAKKKLVKVEAKTRLRR
jgi:hypothetical protein